ncbi:MAG: hypothetical protein P8Y71_15150 [Pseudolabrys sp.]
MTTNASAVILPGTGYRADDAADREQLALKIDGPALTEKLAALTGATLAAFCASRSANYLSFTLFLDPPLTLNP